MFFSSSTIRIVRMESILRQPNQYGRAVRRFALDLDGAPWSATIR